MEHHRRQQETDTLCSAIDRSCETTSLATQMEIKIQPQKMVKNVAGNFPDSLLGHSGKNRVPKLLKE